MPLRGRVVRVLLDGKHYAYRCQANVGDWVECPTVRGSVVVRVVGLGRGGYRGELKDARLVAPYDPSDKRLIYR